MNTAFGRGLPFGSMVAALIIPASAALTPVANSPMASIADPRVTFAYTVALGSDGRPGGVGEAFFVG